MAFVKTSDSYQEMWEYMSQPQRDLILTGEYLLQSIGEMQKENSHFTDFSFLIFPFAKAYEGFLKQLCKDTGLISRLDYISDHLRLGKLLSPIIADKLGEHSLYRKIERITSPELAELIWRVWKQGRNQVFHYFPHNIKAPTYDESQYVITSILSTMERAYREIVTRRVDRIVSVV